MRRRTSEKKWKMWAKTFTQELSLFKKHPSPKKVLDNTKFINKWGTTDLRTGAMVLLVAQSPVSGQLIGMEFDHGRCLQEEQKNRWALLLTIWTSSRKRFIPCLWLANARHFLTWRPAHYYISHYIGRASVECQSRVQRIGSYVHSVGDMGAHTWCKNLWNSSVTSNIYSKIPVTRTLKGNAKPFELVGNLSYSSLSYQGSTVNYTKKPLRSKYNRAKENNS